MEHLIPSKKNMKNIFLVLITLYIVFISTYNITYTNDKRVYTIKYTGLLWVILDHWTIYLYHSDDKPMQWIKYTNKLKQI